jgi:hypothetical protein
MKHTPRFYLGLASLGLSLILPLFGLLVARLPLYLAAKATIIGLLMVGGPESFGILAVVCLGKENLLRIKQKFMALLRRLRPQSREPDPLPGVPGHVSAAVNPHLCRGLCRGAWRMLPDNSHETEILASRVHERT